MYTGKLVFAQVTEHIPMKVFRRCVQTYNGNHKVKPFSCLDQYLCLAFAQLTYRESLRETEICLRAQTKKLYHMGIRGGIARNTLSNANKVRDWRIYADFAEALIKTARPLYAKEGLGLELNNTIYAFDSSTIKLCLSVFPWALFRSTKSAIKLHTLLDLRGNIPTFIHISNGKMHDVNVLDILIPEAGAFYIMDRGYLDFSRLFNINQASAFFVIRAKGNMVYRRQYSHAVTTEEKLCGIRCDQTIVLTGVHSKNAYPQQLRRVKYYDSKSNKTFNFLTNNFTIPAQTVADLYRYRWQVELFFKWIKQHLRIKSFFGISENAVKSQIWIAISVYVLVAIIKKRLDLKIELYTILQILSLTLFEKTPLDQLLIISENKNEMSGMTNQLNLFDLTLGH